MEITVRWRREFRVNPKNLLNGKNLCVFLFQFFVWISLSIKQMSIESRKYTREILLEMEEDFKMENGHCYIGFLGFSWIVDQHYKWKPRNVKDLQLIMFGNRKSKQKRTRWAWRMSRSNCCKDPISWQLWRQDDMYWRILCFTMQIQFCL